ncbi:MAG TPA: TonB-dependent receptor [Agriterribacter sp.]|nr:TonB-dependent receptor [Agriterribacter sp.]
MKGQLTGLWNKLLVATCFCCCIALVAHANEDGNGRIRGKVTTLDGKPAAWVTVQLMNTAVSTITGEDGSFAIKNLKPGVYTVRISYTGLQAIEKQVTIGADGTVELDFTFQGTAKQLDEIVIEGRRSPNLQPVSVGKVPIAPMDLPQSIAVIGQSVIRNQQAQRLSDVIKNVNGVYLGTTRASTQESFYARGYSFSSNNMFKNGSRVNSGVMPEMSSLEKVEVLKGSAAILYGNVAPGGIINMVTKQPGFDFGGEVSMRAGSYDLYKPAFDIYGPVSSKIAVRVNGTYESAGSYRDAVKSKRYYINPSVLFNLDKQTTLLVQADYLDHEFTPDFGIGSLDNTIIPDLPRSIFQGVSWQYNKAKQATATASLKHQLNNSWNLNVTGSYQSYKRDYYSTERVQAAANGDWARPLNKINSDEHYYLGQVDVTGKFKTIGIDHTLLAGADADRYFTTSNTFDNPKIYDTINILDHSKYTQRSDIPAAAKLTTVQTPVNRAGVYVQDLVSITNKLKVLAGVRWSYQMAESAQTTYLGKDSVAKGGSKKDQAFSPRFGLVYKPLSNTAVFASYSNSFSVNNGTDVYGGALAPSLIDQFELGVKNDFFKGLLSANLTVYRVINSNLAQTAQFAADGVTPNNNTSLKELVGETTSDGVELDITGHPAKGLDIMAGYSFNNMRYTETPDTKGSYIEGERLVNTPAHTANASAFYTFNNPLKGFRIGASIFYVGKRNGGWNNTQGQTQQYSRLIPVNGFTTIDISAGYTFKKISLLAKVSNLTNTYNYYVHENYSINPIPPRQFIATVAYRF